jgi:hypothetical protein
VAEEVVVEEEVEVVEGEAVAGVVEGKTIE